MRTGTSRLVSIGILAVAATACSTSISQPKSGDRANALSALSAYRTHVANVHVAYHGTCNASQLESSAGGTAFPVGPYLWLTAEHVVSPTDEARCDGAKVNLQRGAIVLLLEGEVECAVKVIASNPDLDVALLETDVDSEICAQPPAGFRVTGSDSLRVQQQLAVIGYPTESPSEIKAAAGKVDLSAWRRDFPQKLSVHFFDRILLRDGEPPRLLTSSQAVPGDSGSPLIDPENSDVVGMVIERIPGHTRSVPSGEIFKYVQQVAALMHLVHYEGERTDLKLQIKKLAASKWINVEPLDYVGPGKYDIRAIDGAEHVVADGRLSVGTRMHMLFYHSRSGKLARILFGNE